MDQKITAKNENRDPKVLKTLEVAQMLKACEPTLGEVTKATIKYVEVMQKLIDAGKILAAVLAGLADQHGGDLGDGLRATSDLIKQLEAKRSKHAQVLMDTIIDPYSKGDHRPDLNKSEVAGFEKRYKSERAASLKAIKKGEATSRKEAKRKKKNQKALDDALAALSKSVESHDTMLGEMLREIIILDRTRFCNYIKAWNDALLSESEDFDAGCKLIAEKLPELQALAETAQHIDDTESLISNSRPSNALAQIEKVRETGYFPNAPLSLGDDDTLGAAMGGMVSDALGDGEDDPLGAHPVAPYKVRVKQRYDAQNPDEVNLVLGDIFDVTAEIDENWAVAEVHGQRGMFPSNHVEKMRRAGS